MFVSPISFCSRIAFLKRSTMPSKNTRQPVTVKPKSFSLDNILLSRYAIVIIVVLFVLSSFICIPIAILIQVNTPNDPPPTATFVSVAKATSTKSNIATRTPKPIQPTKVSYTSTPKITTFAEISCANKLYKVNLRRTPGYTNKDNSYDSLYEVPCGETVELLGDTEQADGLTWWHVEWNGYIGWIADHTASGKTILIFNP